MRAPKRVAAFIASLLAPVDYAPDSEYLTHVGECTIDLGEQIITMQTYLLGQAQLTDKNYQAALTALEAIAELQARDKDSVELASVLAQRLTVLERRVAELEMAELERIAGGQHRASCGHPADADGECNCAWWPERAPEL